MDESPVKDFVKPADLIKRRPKTLSVSQSPLKCLGNIMEPSPTKKLPNFLRNPFSSLSKPVKRDLRTLIGLDEDANLEPPKMKLLTSSPTKTKMNPSPQHNDLELLRNLDTIYQYPYISWISLHPRNAVTAKEKFLQFSLKEDSVIAQMMFKDWCDSLDNLIERLIEGKCAFFYLCADKFRILFEHHPTTSQAAISPVSISLSNQLEAAGIEVKFPDTVSFLQDMSNQATCDVTRSIDSGNISDEEFIDDEKLEDTRDVKLEDKQGNDGRQVEEQDESQFLESIGWTQREISLYMKPKTNSFPENATRRSSGSVEGSSDLKKLVSFLKSEKSYTLNKVGKFACIPPTLISPKQFKFATVLYANLSGKFSH